MEQNTEAAGNDSPRPVALSPDEVRQWAAAHHPWQVGTGSNRLLRTFKFKDFGDAMRFMVALTPTINELDHHPDWQNVYNQVWVELSTHSVKGVTTNDLRLAEAMDAAAHKIGLK